jgi:UTP-glucose-1-phosphate uridylyltransferase
MTHALIPCGGRGTRMASVAGKQAKEMLPVGGRPVVEQVARECAASGITDVLVVVAPGKESIEAHLAPLAGTPGMPARIDFAVQRDARGLADAIRLGRSFARDGAIAVALPDNMFLADTPVLRQVIDVANGTGKSAVAVVGIAMEEAARRGATAIYGGSPVAHTGEFRITHIPDKGAKSASFDTGGAPVAYTGVGRYAFEPALWRAIDDVDAALPPGEELDDIPVMQLLLHGGLLTGCLVRGDFLDVGVPAGYHEANERWTVRR